MILQNSAFAIDLLQKGCGVNSPVELYMRPTCFGVYFWGGIKQYKLKRYGRYVAFGEEVEVVRILELYI